MASVSIPCPKCHSALKLPSRAYLGRKGKCPKCEHRFILEEPDEIELELAEPEPPATPPVGVAPRWVPDDDAAQVPFIRTPSAAEVPNIASPVSMESPTLVGGGTTVPEFSGIALDPGAGPVVSTPAAETSAAARVRSRRRGRKNSSVGIIAGGVTALLVFAVAAAFALNGSSGDRQSDKKSPAKVNEAWQEEQKSVAADDVAASELIPTKGEPIPLAHVPFTPHLILHVRPSQLWTNDADNRTFLACLGPLGQWLEERILTMGLYDPKEISEITFVANFGPRNTDPDFAAVVRLHSEQVHSDMVMKRMQGKRRTDLDGDVYESDNFAFLIVDRKTFVTTPKSLITDLAAAASGAAIPPVDIAPLLRESDRTRDATILFSVQSLDVHREFLLRSELQQAADEFVLWWGKEIQTVSWSLHLDDAFYMETLIHEKNDSSTRRVQQGMQGRLNRLPELILSMVERMNPPQAGNRRMIGRFPAMMQALLLATTSNTGPGYVRLTTILPKKAASNIALAALLTWDESTRTDFDSAVVATGPRGSTQNLPDTLAERLKVPIEIEFRKTPLQDAFKYIADEIEVSVLIDGDGLKDAAYTQNMEQNIELQTMSASDGIHQIIAQYPRMRILIDEPNLRFVVTTDTFAAQHGLPELP